MFSEFRLNKRKAAFVLVLIMSLALCGSGIKKEDIILDTQTNIVYENILADNLVTSFLNNASGFEKSYKDRYLAVTGKVISKDKNNKSFQLGSVNLTRFTTIECNVDKKNKNYVAGINTGDYVKVYGEVKGTITNQNMEFDVEKVDVAPTLAVACESFSLADGMVYSADSFVRKSLADSRFVYKIPESWIEVEKNIIDNKIGSIEGYQYSLNKLDNGSRNTECVFVCYFDNDLLKNRSISDRKETEKIERAIIGNILNQDPENLKEKFPLSKVTTYYGSKYHYYKDSYKDLNGQGYHAEFVFEADGTKGIKVLLYIYKEAKHMDDILAMLRISADE